MRRPRPITRTRAPDHLTRLPWAGAELRIPVLPTLLLPAATDQPLENLRAEPREIGMYTIATER